MRKILITLAAAASALAIATPASAQYYPQPNYGYSQGYRGQDAMRHNQARLSQLQAQIRQAAMRGRIDPREAQRLDWQVQQFVTNCAIRGATVRQARRPPCSTAGSTG